MSGRRRAIASQHSQQVSADIDAAAAERLLASQSATGLSEHIELAALLAAVAEQPPPGPMPGEREALAAFRTELRRRSAASRPARVDRKRRARLAAAVLGGTLALGSGVTAAATGYLPDPVQETARDMLGRINIDVPGPGSREESTDEEPTPVGTEEGTQDGADDHGTSTGGPGQSDGGAGSGQAEKGTPGKGADISEEASGGRSKAGEEHGGAPLGPPGPLSTDAANPPAPDNPSGKQGSSERSTAGAKPPTAGQSSTD